MKTQYKNLDIGAEKANVKLVVDKFEQVWETKDMELLSRIMAHDATWSTTARTSPSTSSDGRR